MNRGRLTGQSHQFSPKGSQESCLCREEDLHLRVVEGPLLELQLQGLQGPLEQVEVCQQLRRLTMKPSFRSFATSCRSTSSVWGMADAATTFAENAAADELRRKKRKRNRNEQNESARSSAHVDLPDSSDDEGKEELFRGAASGSRTVTVKELALENPGQLFQEGVKEVHKLLGHRGVACESEAASLVTYLTSVFHGSYPQEAVGIRTGKELRTVAEALDMLQAGDLPALGDLLMQRFKSLELSVIDKSFATGSKLELTPDRMVGLSSPREQRVAAQDRLRELKLKDLAQKAGKGGSG